ncbi:MAG TPA: zf-HC2 domain-containing protein [Streptosporangiaceae bacterium]|nr:zf-HC2 domain-containing protein [Streptosporangiaceae bacterium]
MGHLGLYLSAQIDGELEGVERDRVLNHIAGCDACRQEANALRALKRRMTAFGDSSGDAAIAGRLMELARSETDRCTATARSRWQPPLGQHGLGSRQSWLSWRVATGSAGSALLAIGVIAFMLGGTQPDLPVPKVTPAVDAYWTQHNYDTGYLSTRGPGSTRPHSGDPATPVAPANPESAGPKSAGPESAQPTKPAQVRSAQVKSAQRPASPPALAAASSTLRSPGVADPADARILLRLGTP